MTDEGRRFFFKDLLRNVAQSAMATIEEDHELPPGPDDFDKFFESYESSYALTLGYPDDILMETARMEGIECEGREKLDIIKELFQKKGWS
ncbi:MAG: hypothetical protein V2B18_01765 [Pseudomonadota bacterium]